MTVTTATMQVCVHVYLQVGPGQRGSSQVAVLQFGVFQSGDSQVDSRHLTPLHVHALQVSACSHAHTQARARE